MSDVQDQYEAFPYPERDPADEDTRLITGSPSDPREIDHHLFGGLRDWSKPLKVLVAGGGTGDGLIQLAQMLMSAKRPYEITYIDLSRASREVAEARAARRGLAGITFVTGSLLEAEDHGPFDYIDCCGVLHHLPDPDEGFRRLRAALGPGGGLGFMVYAPLGRSGVYPLQEAFGTLFEGLTPEERLVKARRAFEALPDSHPFKSNVNLRDHEASDAGFYDLLLHSQDRAFDVRSLIETLERTGWSLANFCEPLAYDPGRYVEVPDGLDAVTRMALAEKLNGSMKVHVGYARAAGSQAPKASMARVPHLKGAEPRQLAQAVAQGRVLPLKRGGETVKLRLPKASAPLIAHIDGRTSLQNIAARAGVDPIAFHSVWRQVERPLCGWGMMLYSNLLKGV